MTTVKKHFEELFALLEENQNKKVSTLMPQLIELMSKKSHGGGNGSTFVKDDEGNVIAIYCYYHKKWELVSHAEYGAKASNQATGLNTMCKEGVSQWTKAQRVKKLKEQELLTKVASGEILPEDIAVEQARIAEEAKEIIPRADGHGEDLISDLL